ncbi:penicillin-insensitive murein endopeptidase [Bauldia sp.]|uniref:penicillin-insensitive murein endopeptidase n=1 Tax=Bauldia sp. TaxID=2575872 RepID=UPI003BAB2E29
MRNAFRAGLIAAFTIAGIDIAVAQDTVPAKQLFGQMAAPADLRARSIGFYSRGCLAGGVALAVDGPEWQAMRLSRNRYWGMPVLIDYIEQLARESKTYDGWPGLLVGDLSQPRGGPMLFGHASHQVGLDVDIWFDPMPDRTLTEAERETISARSYVKPGTNVDLDTTMWTDAHSRLIKRAASYPEVERVFVNAGVKKVLCEWAGADRAWLRKIRPWYKHDDHLHVRLACPPDMDGCKRQDPTPPGDGCGENLAWWLSDVPYRPAPKPDKPAKPRPAMTLGGLPAACRTVLAAPDPGSTTVQVNIPLPRARPLAN